MPAASIQLNGFAPSVGSDAPEGRGFFRRLLTAIHDAQRHRAEREIARLIELRGGRFTDALERDIERHII